MIDGREDWSISSCVMDIKDLMAHFDYVKFCYISRNLNLLGHKAAKFDISCKVSVLCSDHFLNWLSGMSLV